MSDKNIKTKFYTTQEYGVGSTLEKDFIIKENNVLQEKIISTKTLNEIIENSPYKNKEVDLLNIDVEGHDFKVLFSLVNSLIDIQIFFICLKLKKGLSKTALNHLMLLYFTIEKKILCLLNKNF